MRRYIISHWRGEQSLERSYWMNGVVIGIPFKIMSAVLEIAEPSQMGIVPYTLLAIAYYVPIIPWAIWFAVGVLRSASSHIRRTGRKFWAYVAKFIAVLNLVLLPFIVYVSGIMVWNLGMAAIGRDDFTPAAVYATDNGTLVIQGHIVFETPDAFERLLSENAEAQIVQLKSGGGYIGPASRIAKLIREKELDTYTANICASACTFLFIAGNKRYLDFDGTLGFHQAGLEGVPDDAVASLELEPIELFSDRDVPQSFLDEIQTVSSDSLWKPTLQELVEANIITHVYDYNAEISYPADDYCAQNECSGQTVPTEENYPE